MLDANEKKSDTNVIHQIKSYGYKCVAAAVRFKGFNLQKV